MTTGSQTAAHPISTYNEKPLHAALKEWYAQPGDRFEVWIDGYIVDIVRGDLLIEIQTSGFASIKAKLAALAAHHPVRLVYPVAREKWILRLADDGQSTLSRRRSPKRGAVEEVFRELVRFPHLLLEPHVSLEVVLVEEEEVRGHEPGRAWRRRGWVRRERRLLAVVEQQLFQTPADFAALLPGSLAEPFSTSDLATALGRPRYLAQKMAYCLRAMAVIEPVGKRGHALLYARTAG